MNYRIEVYDTWGRRIAHFDETPLLEVTRATPDQADSIRGILPGTIASLGPAYRVRVLVNGALFCEAKVTRLAPQWSDARKLILDRYVHFHEVVTFEAGRPPRDGSRSVVQAYRDAEISAIVKHATNSALGPAHYRVAHEAYPDGATREYQKFLTRKTAENELEVGGISAGQWVGGTRIDASAAYAIDGDTIGGLVIDGQPWPDFRLMMIDCEETSRNSHAITRHPEIESWTEAQYSRSGYKLRADEAKAALQGLLDSEGIDFIELNPHRDSVGEFDNRVDAYGRYVGLVYGDDKCLNAAMVELGHADVYLYEDGRYLVPEMELKDYLSYSSAQDDSIEATDVVMNALDVSAGLYEILTALAYAADGFIWSVDPRLAVSFRRAEQPDHVWFFNPVAMGVTLGSDSTQVANTIYFEGNPLEAAVKKTYQSAESLATYGERARDLVLYSISSELDADQLIEGLLKDLAYPEPSGAVVCFRGHGAVQVGDIVELRGGPLRRLEPEVDGEWDDRFRGRLVGRVREVTHRFEGKHAVTTVQLTSPLRSVQNPIDSMTRSQPDPETFFQFRLDDTVVGLDLQFHLD